MRDSRLTAAKQYRLNNINNILSQLSKPKRAFKIDVDMDKSSTLSLLQWMTNIGLLEKIAVLVDGVASTKAFEYVRKQDSMSVEEFINGRKATSKRKVVEQRATPVKKEWEAIYVNGVLNVPERHPKRHMMDKKPSHRVYIGSSFGII